MSIDFQLVSSTVVPLTPDLAKQFATMEASPTERKLNPDRVKYLKEKAEAGQLITFQWVTAQFGNKEVRMNGQHSSSMLAALETDKFPKNGKVLRETYKVESAEGMANLYGQMDSRRQSRTPQDISQSWQGIYPDIGGVDPATAKLAVEGVNWWRRSVEKTPALAGDQVYTLFSELALHPFIKWTGELFSSKTPEFKRNSIVAAMYATYISSEPDARKFWDTVSRKGDPYNDNDPTTVLDTWLQELHRDADFRKKVGTGGLYQGCVYAWNATREGKTIKDIKYDARKGFSAVS